jgi:hypothetical protein
MNFHHHLHSVASILGGKVVTVDGYDARAEIDLGQPWRILCSESWAGRGRHYFSGTFAEKGIPHSQSPNVTTGATRAPEAVAADLRRRLLPDVQKWAAKCLQYHQEQKAKELNRKLFLSNVAERLGLNPAVQWRNYGGASGDFSLDNFAIMRTWDCDDGNKTVEIKATVSKNALPFILDILKEDRKFNQA